jgi:hypothetical protein
VICIHTDLLFFYDFFVFLLLFFLVQRKLLSEIYQKLPNQKLCLSVHELVPILCIENLSNFYSIVLYIDQLQMFYIYQLSFSNLEIQPNLFTILFLLNSLIYMCVSFGLLSQPNLPICQQEMEDT